MIAFAIIGGGLIALAFLTVHCWLATNVEAAARALTKLALVEETREGRYQAMVDPRGDYDELERRRVKRDDEGGPTA